LDIRADHPAGNGGSELQAEFSRSGTALRRQDKVYFATGYASLWIIISADGEYGGLMFGDRRRTFPFAPDRGQFYDRFYGAIKRNTVCPVFSVG
jgi:hypothetical protein